MRPLLDSDTNTSLRHKPNTRTRLLLATCLVAIGVALVFLLSFWTQSNRPGMAHLQRGMEYVASKRYQDAEREWRLGVQQDPRCWQCYEQLGLLYTELRRFSDAEQCYVAAARIVPDNAGLYLPLSRLQATLGDFKAAEASAQKAAQAFPNDADAVGQYGLMAAKQKDTPTALAALRRAHQMQPDSARYLIGMVSLEMDAMDMSGAERDLTPFLKAHPDAAEASYFIAVIYNQKPRTPANLAIALHYAESARRGMSRDERVYSLLGQLYLDAKRTTDALHTFQQGTTLSRNSESMMHGLISCYTRRGDFRAAEAVAIRLRLVNARHDRIDHLRHVMGFNHQDTTAALELARLEEEDGNVHQALLYYSQIVRQAPQDPRTHPALTAFLRRTGRPELAQQAAQPDFVP